MRLSNYKKPDAITTMNKDEYRDKAWPLPISESGLIRNEHEFKEALNKAVGYKGI